MNWGEFWSYLIDKASELELLETGGPRRMVEWFDLAQWLTDKRDEYLRSLSETANGGDSVEDRN